MDRDTPTVFVVSDGRGRTGRLVVQAALVQFAESSSRIEIRSGVRTPERAAAVVAEAAACGAVLFHTLVVPDARDALRKAAELHELPTVDILGPPLRALHDLFHSDPGARPGLLYEVYQEDFDRHDAIDFTLAHDDGQRQHDLSSADVVLVGVSRSAKSTTCFYLAYRGIKAANVPLVPGIPVPKSLLALDPRKVVGLKINAVRLQSVREERAMALGRAQLDEYLDKRAINREIREAHDLMDRHGWRSVRVSYKAVEEIAKEVLELLAEG